jgi:hypothetical protein
MARLLTVARVTVPPRHQEEYQRVIHQLAALGAARGQHLWVFQSATDTEQFLEFSESRTEMSHRSRASRTDLELKLERRLLQIAEYAPGATDLWEELPAPEPTDVEEP